MASPCIPLPGGSELNVSRRPFIRGNAPFAAFATLVTVLGGGVACLPADMRPPPGSILLTVRSADEPSVTTVDGWSITVDRLLVGMGEAALWYPCSRYSEGGYTRLLDGRLAKDQKVALMYGLGHCDFVVQMIWPSQDSLLGEGVSEGDRDRMAGDELKERTPGRQGIAVDFAATATRGGQTKRVHWLFSQAKSYQPCTRGTQDNPRPIALQSGENLSLSFGLRGTALFGDNADRDATVLRFDPVAAADTTFGNADDEVTLNELQNVTLDVARRSGGAYVTGKDFPGPSPTTLRDFIHLVTLGHLVVFPEGITCNARLGIGRPPR